ncbi:MAG: type III pantothenate kinase, partial [Lachnospiraceae bacterium]|nr:type III pantothenate kinase [Lachnospiraceae bacterium]
IGTATTISVVDKNRNYIGGMILPGVRVSVDSLTSRTAQLPKIALEAPSHCIGKNTVNCMQSGVIYGHAGAIDGLIDRIEEELGYTARIIATGGLAQVVVPNCRHDIILDDELLLKGLKIIYDKNR